MTGKCKLCNRSSFPLFNLNESKCWQISEVWGGQGEGRWGGTQEGGEEDAEKAAGGGAGECQEARGGEDVQGQQDPREDGQPEQSQWHLSR